MGATNDLVSQWKHKGQLELQNHLSIEAETAKHKDNLSSKSWPKYSPLDGNLRDGRRSVEFNPEVIREG